MTALVQSEADLQRAVIDLARFKGYLVFHARPARTSNGWRTAMSGDPGWPDLALAGNGRFLVIELKSERGRVSPEQRLWLAELAAAGVEVHVVRPSDFDTFAETL